MQYFAASSTNWQIQTKKCSNLKQISATTWKNKQRGGVLQIVKTTAHTLHKMEVLQTTKGS